MKIEQTLIFFATYVLDNLNLLWEALNIFKYRFPVDLYIMNMVRYMYTKKSFEVKYYILLFKIHAKQDKEMKWNLYKS